MLKFCCFFLAKKKPAGFQIFENFENEKYVHIEDLPHMINYIGGNLNSDNCLNYKHWCNQYSYSKKAYIVCRWRQEKDLQPVVKWGDAIYNGELVNIFKEHKGYHHGCGSVYYK